MALVGNLGLRQSGRSCANRKFVTVPGVALIAAPIQVKWKRSRVVGSVSRKIWFDAIVQSSGSTNFDALRSALAGQPGLRAELESALLLNVQRVNPTDRANRFGSGAAVEWILAAAAFSSGVVSVPGGHNLNGFDLRDVRDRARGLWSVKNQTRRGDFRISNGLGGGGRGFVEPTLFLSPSLPGIVFVDPALHPDVALQARETGDAVVLPFGAILRHAEARPDCVARCNMPSNPGNGQFDPWMNYVRDLLSADRFPLLAQLFVAAAPRSSDLTDQIRSLVALRESSALSEEQYQAALDLLLD